MPNDDDDTSDFSSDTSSETSPADSSVSTGSLDSDFDSDFEDDFELDTQQDQQQQDPQQLQDNAASKYHAALQHQQQQHHQHQHQQQQQLSNAAGGIAQQLRKREGFSRARSLGQKMGAFTDKMLLKIAQMLRPRDLVLLGYVSWMWLVVAHDEPTWRRLVLLYCVDRKTKVGNFCYHGSWRRTMLHPKRFPNRNWTEQDVTPPPCTTLPPPFSLSSVQKKKNDGVDSDAAVGGGGASSSFWMLDSATRPRYARIRKTRHMKWYDNVRHPPERNAMFNLSTSEGDGGIGIERRANLTYPDFVEQYEKPNRPVILTDAARDWPALKKWTHENFAAHYGETLFRVNCRSTRGYRFKMRMFDYLAYCHTANAEKFLYVFDKTIVRRNRAVRADWHRPVYFAQDLFNLMREQDRPDYQWMIVGPNGSGSPLHTDPSSTSAANCVLAGAKRVTFYPPYVRPPHYDVKLIDTDMYPSDDVRKWYQQQLPKVPRDQQPIDCIVYPGEMLFIPAMWYHSVQNLGTTIAVTWNWCSLQNFPMVAEDMNRSSGRGLRQDFKCALAESQYKALADYIIVHPRTSVLSSVKTFTVTMDAQGNPVRTSNDHSGAVDQLQLNAQPPYALANKWRRQQHHSYKLAMRQQQQQQRQQQQRQRNGDQQSSSPTSQQVAVDPECAVRMPQGPTTGSAFNRLAQQFDDIAA